MFPMAIRTSVQSGAERSKQCLSHSTRESRERGRAKSLTRGLDLSDLKYVAASADAGNFAQAGKALGLYPSTVSRRVTRFEDKLGLTLFERGRFGLRLTEGGRAVLVHIRRALADLEAVQRAGTTSATGEVGQIRLGVCTPPSGEPIGMLMRDWRLAHPLVGLTISEMTEREIHAAFEERRLDAAFVPRHALWPRAVSLPICRERFFAAVPVDHVLKEKGSVTWPDLSDETLLVQDWEDSHSSREFFVSLLGNSVSLRTHAASTACILALVGSGFGITLVTESQAQVRFPGVIYLEIVEADAWIDIEITWTPNSEEAVVGRFVAFMRDQARERLLHREIGRGDRVQDVVSV